MTAHKPDRSVELGALVASMELKIADRQRQIELLKLTVERHRRESERAQSQTAMIQCALDRHLAHCDMDQSAVQKLLAEIAESKARRKEQVAVIERRDRRIAELQQQLNLLHGSLPDGSRYTTVRGAGNLLARLKQMLKRARAS